MTALRARAVTPSTLPASAGACPRLPDAAWNALLLGQRTADGSELGRHTHVLLDHVRRLGAALPRR